MVRTRWLAFLLASIFILALVIAGFPAFVNACEEDDPEEGFPADEVFAGEDVYLPDPNLAQIVREAIGIGPEDPIRTGGLGKLTKLQASKSGIKDLSGLESAVALKTVKLSENERLSDLGPLSGLFLTHLDLSNTAVASFPPFTNPEKLEKLYLNQTSIKGSLATLKQFTQLKELEISDNGIRDLSPLAANTSLTRLYAGQNEISDISPLAALADNLVTLKLWYNKISDVTPLLKIKALRTLYIKENPFSESAAYVFAELRARGVSIDTQGPNWVPKTPVTGVTLNHDSLSLEPGGNEQLIATIVPADATNKAISWSTDNKEIAGVKDGLVTAFQPGVAIVTVTSQEGAFSASCRITVSAPEPSEIAFKYTNVTLEAGTAKAMEIIVSPANAWAKWVWLSSNPSIATVTSEGVVNALAPGITTISVSSGSIAAECYLTVVDQGESVQYTLEKAKHCLSIPKEVLEGKNRLNIKHDKMQLVIPTKAWLDALAPLQLADSESVSIEVEQYHPVPSDKLQAVGPAYNFSLRVNEIQVTEFADKLLLTFIYEPTQIKRPENLAIYWFNESSSSWDKLPSIVDRETNTVSALVNHWSSFALMQPAGNSQDTLVYLLLAALGLNALVLLIVLLRRR